jgi:RNA processing factor Prp31
MSDINIDASTTATELYREVFTEYYYTYEAEFAKLIESHPEYEELIRQAWLEAEVYNIAYEGFKDFFFSIIAEQVTIFEGQFNY